jgi:hypothetical protein
MYMRPESQVSKTGCSANSIAAIFREHLFREHVEPYMKQSLQVSALSVVRISNVWCGQVTLVLHLDLVVSCDRCQVGHRST